MNRFLHACNPLGRVEDRLDKIIVVLELIGAKLDTALEQRDRITGKAASDGHPMTLAVKE